MNISSIQNHRRVGRAKAVTDPDPNTTGSNESDTNADTCCLGQNCIHIAYPNRSADVYPYSEAYEPIENVPTISWATFYDQKDGDTYTLVFHESLYYGSQMKHCRNSPQWVH